MDTVISLITSWKDLIVKVFGAHTLAGAVVTLIAAGIFYLLHTQYRKEKVASNAFWVFFGWAITVPIFGLVFDVGGELYGATKKVLDFLWSALSSLYAIYTKHPILVLVVFAVAIIAYFVWAWLRPKLIPSKPLRAFILLMVTVAVAHLLSPLVDLFVSPSSSQQHQIPDSASQPSAPTSTVSPPAVQFRPAPAPASSASAASAALMAPSMVIGLGSPPAASQAKP